MFLSGYNLMNREGRNAEHLKGKEKGFLIWIYIHTEKRLGALGQLRWLSVCLCHRS